MVRWKIYKIKKHDKPLIDILVLKEDYRKYCERHRKYCESQWISYNPDKLINEIEDRND